MVMNNYLADPEIFDKLNASTIKDEWYGPLIIAASNLISSILPIAALLYSLLHAIEQKEEIRKTTITSKSVQEANETASLVSSSH